MDESAWLAQRFEAERPHLRAVAYRMLGRLDEVDDAVQESWLRLSGSDTSSVANLSAWLTTVVARVCLDMLRARHARREESMGVHLPDLLVDCEGEIDPEQEAELSEAVGLALLVILDKLSPAERLAFVLHDLFAVPFDEIARIVERSETAARQLASRARRRVQTATRSQDADLTANREVVNAFLAAAREGDFEALLSVLDPDIVLRADRAAVQAGAPREVRGATAVARQFLGRAWEAQPALVNGAMGLVWAPGEQPRVVFGFTMTRGKIVAIDVVADPARLRQLHLSVLEEKLSKERLPP